MSPPPPPPTHSYTETVEKKKQRKEKKNLCPARSRRHTRDTHPHRTPRADTAAPPLPFPTAPRAAAMDSTACLRLPFLPARTRPSSSSSSSPRRAARASSIKCCAAASDAGASSASISSASPRRPDVVNGVGPAGVDGLAGPPVPVPDSPAPASRDLHWLPRK